MTDECDPTIQDCEMMMEEHDDHDGHAISPMMANVSVTLLTFFNLLGVSTMYFRYKNEPSKMSYYTNGDAPNVYATEVSTNLWKASNDVRSAAGLLTWGVLFVTQALSMAGIAPAINVQAFMILIPVWMIGNMVAQMIAMYGKDKSWAIWNADNTKAAAGAMAGVHEGELWTWMAKNTAIMLTLWVNHESWWKGQYKMMDEETRAEFKEGKGEDDMMFRKFYFGF